MHLRQSHPTTYSCCPEKANMRELSLWVVPSPGVAPDRPAQIRSTFHPPSPCRRKKLVKKTWCDHHLEQLVPRMPSTFHPPSACVRR